MSQYELLNRTISFDEAADRYLQLQFFSWTAASNARAEFENWYRQSGGIYNVLKGYWDAVKNVVTKHTINPLYDTLAVDYHIYNISKETYRKACLDLEEAVEVYDLAVDLYNDIEDQLEEEREYRQYRKASRAEVVGGGFGLGGALKGMATAGAINMATGAAHSMANAIGNAGSASDAAEKKKGLYNDAYEPFGDAIERCVLATAFGHIGIVNENSALSIRSTFDSDQGTALFESALKIPEKREELLVETFKIYPWYYKLYPYIFKNYPQERRNLIAISKDFHVGLSDTIDEVLAVEYTSDARNSESLAMAARQRILEIMDNLGVGESKVLDELETDCLQRLCNGYLSADEAECNRLIDAVKNYSAFDRNKKVFLDKIQKRIETIWAAEDGEIFDNYLLQLNILNPSDVSAAINYVTEKGRTEDAKKYINALNAYNYKRIKRARLYRFCAKPGILSFVLKYIGIVVALYGVYQFANEWEWSFWSQIFPMVGGIAWEFCIFELKSEWELLTVNGKVMHPIFTIPNDTFEKKHTEVLMKHTATNNPNNTMQQQN